ncbi:MAG TPA: HAMP domain-containing sensor histidine kinase [Kofleriaceae bacterium]|nr:HAMP domain-containing sensor histidine kinase [Kofleriaceae bacterium]
MIGSVVLAFVVAAAAAQYVQREITTPVNDIVSNAMPSVKLLSAARGHLREIELGVDADATPPDPRIAMARRNLDEELTSYRALPPFPHERALFQPVLDDMTKLDADYAAWSATHAATVLAALRFDFETVDAALERAIAFDAEQGQRLGLEIGRVRGETTGVVMVLDGVAVALALVAAALALRQLRRAARAWRSELTARERREAELREMNEALGQFAGRVAHDILSPLATTSLAIDRLRQACPDEATAASASDRGMNALRRVHALVDGLLAFARAGGHPQPGATAELRHVLEDMMVGLKSQAELRGVTLTLDDVPPGAVACHDGVLASIVSNLVQNSIKYMDDARERRITVHVRDAGSRWRVEVADTGRGIPKDQRATIFEPYVQLTKGSGGIGLGLATVERLVHAHGGTLGVRSEVGVGSTFWFELPKAPAQAVGASELQPVPA